MSTTRERGAMKRKWIIIPVPWHEKNKWFEEMLKDDFKKNWENCHKQKFPNFWNTEDREER